VTDEPREHDESEPQVEGDVLPDELDVTAYVGPYQFPDIRRRLVAATIYLVLSLGCAIPYALGASGGLLVAAIVLLVIAVYHVLAAWPLRIDQTEALATASRAVGFPIGHASAQLAFRGLRSRPVWHVLVYSADSPPSIRGLVEVDAVSGRVLGEYTERNPEDWSELGRGVSAGRSDEDN
jgi:hypothetical protein